MEEKIMVVFPSPTKGKVVVISDNHRIKKMDDVVKIVGYNSEYVSVIHSSSQDKITVYDSKGYRKEIINLNSSNYL